MTFFRGAFRRFDFVFWLSVQFGKKWWRKEMQGKKPQGRIELPTFRLLSECSTDWAIEALKFISSLTHFKATMIHSHTRKAIFPRTKASTFQGRLSIGQNGQPNTWSCSWKGNYCQLWHHRRACAERIAEDFVVDILWWSGRVELCWSFYC